MEMCRDCPCKEDHPKTGYFPGPEFWERISAEVAAFNVSIGTTRVGPPEPRSPLAPESQGSTR